MRSILMRWRRIGWCAFGSAWVALSAHVAQAITVDGKLDVGYTLLPGCESMKTSSTPMSEHACVPQIVSLRLPAKKR